MFVYHRNRVGPLTLSKPEQIWRGIDGGSSLDRKNSLAVTSIRRSSGLLVDTSRSQSDQPPGSYSPYQDSTLDWRTFCRDIHRLVPERDIRDISVHHDWLAIARNTFVILRLHPGEYSQDRSALSTRYGERTLAPVGAHIGDCAKLTSNYCGLLIGTQDNWFVGGLGSCRTKTRISHFLIIAPDTTTRMLAAS